MSMEMKKPKVDEKTGQIEMPLVQKTVKEEEDIISERYGIPKERLFLKKGIWYAVTRGGQLLEPAVYAERRDDENNDKKIEEARIHARPRENKNDEYSEEPKPKSEFIPGVTGVSKKAYNRNQTR